MVAIEVILKILGNKYLQLNMVFELESLELSEIKEHSSLTKNYLGDN